MSAVALNPSLAAPWSLEPPPGSASEPSGAFSFASVLNRMDTQDAAAIVDDAPTGAANSQNAAAGPEGTTADPTSKGGPLSIEAELAALGYGSSDAAQGSLAPGAVSQASAASVPNPKAVAAQSPAGAMRASPSVAATAGSKTASPAVSSANQNIVSDDTTGASDPSSTEAELATGAYGQFDASRGVVNAGAVSQGSGASARAQKTGAAPQRQSGSPWPIRSSASAPSTASISQTSAASDRKQATVAASQSGVGSSPRTSQSLAPLEAGASDPSQASLFAGLISQAVVPQDPGAAAPKQATVAAHQIAGGPLPRTDSSPAVLSGASDIGSPLFADTASVGSYAAAANPLTADPSLGLQSLQSRTHLAMTNAVPVRTTGPAGRTTASTTAAPVSASAASAAALDANSGGGQTADEPPTPAASIPRADAPKTGATAASSPDPSFSVAGAGLDPGSSRLALPLSRVADFVADQANSLTSQSPSTAAARTSSLSAPQSVKELEISLDPANLGALSVKMRLANGKLSVVIGVANPSTLGAIQSERGAILDRLGMGQLPLENLVITSRASSPEFAQSASGGNNESDAADPRQDRSNDNSSGAQRGDGGSARARSAPSAGSGSSGSPSGGGSGVLLV